MNHDITVQHVLDEKKKAIEAIRAAIAEFTRATGFPVADVTFDIVRVEGKHRADLFPRHGRSSFRLRASGAAMTVARCTVPECTRRRPAERLMCGPHWKHVPRRLQRDVWSAYRQAEAAGVKPLESPDYVKAAQAAIDAAKRGTPRPPAAATGAEQHG
jgi:hypothetical protein